MQPQTYKLLFREIAANPDKDRIGILYKHGCYGEGVAVNSLVPYICHMDADGSKLELLKTLIYTPLHARAQSALRQEMSALTI